MTVSYGPHAGIGSTGVETPAIEASLADILHRLSLADKTHLSVRDMTEALGERSLGASLTVFALPNLMPLPPGSTVIFGIPLLIVTWQMMVNAGGGLRLPARFADYRIEKNTFAAFAGRAIPWLRYAERWLKPRLAFANRRLIERLLGAFALLLATVVFLPIPLGNWMPALALAIIGLTLSARDGLWLMAGIGVGILSFFVVAGAVTATVAALAWLL